MARNCLWWASVLLSCNPVMCDRRSLGTRCALVLATNRKMMCRFVAELDFFRRYDHPVDVDGRRSQWEQTCPAYLLVSILPLFPSFLFLLPLFLRQFLLLLFFLPYPSFLSRRPSLCIISLFLVRLHRDLSENVDSRFTFGSRVHGPMRHVMNDAHSRGRIRWKIRAHVVDRFIARES